jgi:hypothetical protein
VCKGKIMCLFYDGGLVVIYKQSNDQNRLDLIWTVITWTKDIRSNIYHRLKKQLAMGQIKLSLFFERLGDDTAYTF